MSEVKKCLKCGGNMKAEKPLARWSPVKHIDRVFEESGQDRLLTAKDWVAAYACQDCGYVESYIYKPTKVLH